MRPEPAPKADSKAAWAADQTRFVLAAACDLNGCFRGKRVEAASLEKLQSGGMRMPMSALGVDIWGTDSPGLMQKGDLDGICEPTGRGPLPLMWTSTPAQLLPMWMRHEDGRPYLGDPRRMLAAVLDRYATMGLTPMVATELEFYLIRPDTPRPEPLVPVPHGHQGARDTIYSLDELADVGPFLDDVYRMAAACGVAVDAAVSESGPSQFEFNLKHAADALRVADDTLFFKQIVKSMARKHGYAASFMAKPYPAHSGNGLHVHFSLLDAEGRNLFDDGGPAGTALMRQAVAGLVAAMPDCTAIFAPHLNSFRRLCPGTLAPTAAAWGYENRTAALRIPGGPTAARRIEHRVAGADANPYLVLAAILAAAFDGIDRQAEPPPPTEGPTPAPGTASLPSDWRSALTRLADSATVTRLFHPELITAFLACKHQEVAVFDRDISDLEYASYLHSV